MRFFLYILLPLLPSCATLSLLKEDIRSINHDARIVGRIEPARGGSVKVFVCKRRGDGLEIVDSGTPNILGDFMFLLPGGEPYFLAAIDDTNGNGRLDEAEPITYYGNGSLDEIPAARGFTPAPVKLGFDKTRATDGGVLARIEKAYDEWIPSDREQNGSVNIACGEVVALDDPLFSRAKGSRGLWAPATAIRQSGMGIYFLEKYNSAKTPVLFIHGIGGSPKDLSKLIGTLDRRRFQPWVYAYPSGVRLESAAKGAANLMDRLEESHGFEKVHVIAYSMGGLVGRRLVQMIGNERERDYIATLTTISTPWNGVPSAGIGMRRFPVPIPCWEDLQPGSDFSAKILDDPLPVPHLLIYTEKSKFSLLLPARNDGEVSVASQLASRAVEQCQRLLVFEKTHLEVLDDEEAGLAISRFLNEKPATGSRP